MARRPVNHPSSAVGPDHAMLEGGRVSVPCATAVPLALSFLPNADRALTKEARHMRERVVRVHGLALATEAFGSPAHAPVLLIMGGMASMLWWPEAFCARLAGQGRYVLRY